MSTYDGTFREAGLIVIFMNPLKALMLAEALIRGTYGLLMLNHLRFFCFDLAINSAENEGWETSV